MAETLDYSEVHPENRWKILRAQWRFALWALYSSLGSVMLGFDMNGGLQMLAMVRDALTLLSVGSIPKTIWYSLLYCTRRIFHPIEVAEWMEWGCLWRRRRWLPCCHFLIESNWP
jgi:hypothetical protein